MAAEETIAVMEEEEKKVLLSCDGAEAGGGGGALHTPNRALKRPRDQEDKEESEIPFKIPKRYSTEDLSRFIGPDPMQIVSSDRVEDNFEISCYEATNVRLSRDVENDVEMFCLLDEGRIDLPELIARKVVKTKKINGDDAREYDALKECQHPNIVKLYYMERAFDHRNGTSYIRLYTELCEQNLRDFMMVNMLTTKHVRSLSRQLIDGIAFLHEKLVVHRDIKPENVLVNMGGDGGSRSPTEAVFKLADFGLARFLPEEFSESFTSTACGTRPYASPEMYQAMHNQQELPGNPYSSDIFSLGVVIFEMATKKLPFDSKQLFVFSFSAEDVNHVIKSNIEDIKLCQGLNLMLQWKKENRASIQQVRDYFFDETMDSQGSSSLREVLFCFSIQPNEAKKALDKILDILKMNKYYPEKLTLNDVRKRSVEMAQNLADVPWCILQKILALDYKGFNSNLIPESGPQPSQSAMSSECENTNDNVSQTDVDINEDDDDDDEDDALILLQTPDKLTSEFHPRDILVAIYLCASPTLRMILAEKMFLCRISIPLILPDLARNVRTLLLETVRNVICTDKMKREASIVDHKCCIVSIVNVGRAFTNKASLLNSVIGGHSSPHEVFRNHHSEKMASPMISTGLVDMGWILPSRKQGDKLLPNITLLLNIHDEDNKCSAEERKTLFHLSSITILLISANALFASELKSTHIKLIEDICIGGSMPVIIVNDSQRLFTDSPTDLNATIKKLNTLTGVVAFKARKKNIFVARDETSAANCMIEAIKNQPSNLKSLNDHELKSRVKQQLCELDEDNEEWSKGRELSAPILTLMSNKELATIKLQWLRCQILWRTWVLLQKKLKREAGRQVENPETFVANIQSEMANVRKKQEEQCFNLSFLMRNFLTQFVNPAFHPRDNKVLHFMLTGLQQGLDDFCRGILPDLNEKLKGLWSKLSDLKSKRNDQFKGEIDKVEKEYQIMEKKICESSLGLEHLMREMGQMYEAVQATGSKGRPDINITILPDIMAELLLNGHNIELIDGDASHVPLTWVTSVLDKLKQKIGDDKKVFVLSILGLQSSGKSTLLNAMFGLQFAVSAGRCTRGVYGQLIPTCPDVTPDIDYILVLDTEGLRAPELGSDTNLHDHEIATFVIGLGDTTIINMKGELMGEMHNVLQIVVHAFLRISLVDKTLKLRPSCIFVHHNVGAIDALDKNWYSNQKLQTLLNEMTKAAADLEGVGHIEQFTDVIKFDLKIHVKYFAELWHGDPPMAPINPGYSKDVKELKDLIFKSANTTNTISKVALKIHNIWSGILNENFVFSFRNGIEIRAYTALELELSSIQWDMRIKSMEKFSKAKNEIKSSGPNSDLDQLLLEKLQEIEGTVEEVFQSASSKLETFIRQNKDNEILEQSQMKSKNRLEEEKTIIVKDFSTELRKQVKNQRAENELAPKIEDIKNHILQFVKLTAKTLQRQPELDNQDLLKKFDMAWEESIGDKVLPLDEIETSQIPIMLFQLIYKVLPRDLHHMVPSQPESLNQAEQSLHFYYYKLQQEDLKKMTQLLGTTQLTDQEIRDIINPEMEKAFNKIDIHLRTFSDSSFNETNAGTIFKLLDTTVKDINTQNKNFFNLTKSFRVNLFMFVHSYIASKFVSFQKAYMDINDPRLRLEKTYRKPIFLLFKNIQCQNTGEKSAAELICKFLMPKIKDVIDDEMPRLLAESLQQQLPCFKSKKHLETRILGDLLKADNFDKFMEHINKTTNSFGNFVEEIVNHQLFDTLSTTTKTIEIKKLLIQGRSPNANRNAIQNTCAWDWGLTGIGGADDRDLRNQLNLNSCCTSVASKSTFRSKETKMETVPFKDYKKFYPNWDIPPDTSADVSLYWKYVFARFCQNFAKAYNAKEPEIPATWLKITKEEALRSLIMNRQLH